VGSWARKRLTFANVCSALALFIALGTGSAYAANTIGSSDVIDESLQSQDIKNQTIQGGDIAPGTLGNARFKDLSITGIKLADATITGNKLANATITGAKLAPNTLGGAQIVESDLGQVPSAALAGSAPVRGRVIVQSAEISNPGGQQSMGQVVCPAGKTSIGGGVYGNSGGTLQSVNGSYPTSNGWGGFVNNNGADDSFVVYAVCAFASG
jgi:hypothetical protein